MLANLDPQTAQYIYRVIGALIPLLLLAGLITPEQVELWLQLAAAVLGLGTTVTAAVRVTAQRKAGILP